MKYDVVLYSAMHTEPQTALAQVQACVAALTARCPSLSHIVLVLPTEMMSVLEAGSDICWPDITKITVNKKQPLGSFCNRGARGGDASWILFLDISRVPDEGFWEAAEQAIVRYPEAGALTCRLLPSQDGQHVDPVTLEAFFLRPEAMIVSRQEFDAIGGFDVRLPGRAAAEDFALRLRAEGSKKIYYVPFAVLLETVHPAQEALRDQYIEEQLGELLLAYKYGNAGLQRRRYRGQIKAPRHFPNVRKLLFANYLRHFFLLWPCWLWRFTHPKGFRTARDLREESPACALGPDTSARRCVQGPQISVVIRTHARPQRLRNTLLSVANQTYQNYEIVVVEDGEATAREMIENEFACLPIRYIATGAPVGRSRAGNLGMQEASGEYLNLLDDDDYFYPEHLELFAAQAVEHPNADILFGFSVAILADVESEDPYKLAIKGLRPITYDRLDVFTMSQNCQIPIEGALFKKDLLLKCGGLDENLDAHEDWAMWLRFLAVAQRAHFSKVDVARATTLFLQPADPQIAHERMREYMKSDAAFFADESIRFTVTLAQMRSFYDGVLADVRHVKNLGELDDFLQTQADREKN